MAKQTTEEELNLMRQTRRRLIGAVALVVAVVILLPIVFDSEPAPSKGNDIELRIPNKDNVGELPPLGNLPQPAVPVSGVVAASAAVSAPVAASAPAAQAAPATPAPAVGTPQAKIEAKPAVKPKADSKPVARTQAVPKSGWALQAGAFSNAGAAHALQAKLSKQGYHAYTEKAGNIMRVRIGGYATREAAEKAQHKLQAHGTHCNVVSLE